MSAINVSNITSSPRIYAQPIRSKVNFGCEDGCSNCGACKSKITGMPAQDSFEKLTENPENLRGALIKVASALLTLAGVEGIQPKEA